MSANTSTAPTAVIPASRPVRSPQTQKLREVVAVIAASGSPASTVSSSLGEMGAHLPLDRGGNTPRDNDPCRVCRQPWPCADYQQALGVVSDAGVNPSAFVPNDLAHVLWPATAAR